VTGAILLAALALPSAALAGAGGLDPRFGSAGRVALTDHGRGSAVAMQPDGKMVFASTARGTMGVERVVVSRLLVDGTPDPGFGDGGVVLPDPTRGGEPYDVAIAPDGKIVVAGTSPHPESGVADAAVHRLNADGSLDLGFSGDGRAYFGGIYQDVIRAVAVLPNGKILVAGYTDHGERNSYDGIVYRLLQDGEEDPAFDDGGYAQVDSAGDELPLAMALQPDGKILLAGISRATVNSPGNAVLHRLKPDGGPGGVNGALDETFDTDGVAGFDSGGDDGASAVAIAADGAILVAGLTSAGAKGDDAVVYKARPSGGSGVMNGALDTSFAGDGSAEVDTGGDDAVNALELQPDGKLVLAGSGNGAAVVHRLRPTGGGGLVNGALDRAFGGSGTVRLPGSVDAAVHGIAVGADRRIVTIGLETDGQAARHPVAFRLLGDPFTLTAQRTGSGSGTVTSGAAGITCGTVCSGIFDTGSLVTLTATSDPGSVFSGWSGGACSGSGACTVTLSADTTVGAVFAPIADPPRDTTRVGRAPRARLTRKPKGRVKSRRRTVWVTFGLAADPLGARLQCRIDKKPFRTCKTTVRLTVKHGSHRFQVRARNADGTGPTLSYRFRVVR
jgi:uncharacterized delta-60 repeat protein